jgi:DNA adenine methylase
MNPNAPAPADPGWLHYVEPYFGGGAVLLANDPEGIGEVVNDLNAELTNFWRVLKDEKEFTRFLREAQCTPFSEPEFEAAVERRDAFGFFVRCRQSLAGRMKDFAPLTRNRTRRGMNEQASAWLSCIEGLPAVHERLQRVTILNHDATDVIREQDGPRTLFYCDPPYLPETRTVKEVYDHEMTRDQHQELLNVLLAVKGKVILSGYANDLYDSKLATWTRHVYDLPNHAAGGIEKRRVQEVLWCNY